MANPVWVLSVNLEAKTAAFTTGMGEAARNARSAFNDIGDSAKKSTDKVKKGLFDVRHGLGLVDNVMRGQHSQAMADMVREFQNSAVVMTALPVAAVVAGIALIGGIAYEAYEHLEKMREATEKVNNDLEALGTTANNAFMKLDDQILKAEEKTDELTGQHLAALRKELELIDHQSLEELAQQFESLEKPVMAVFKELKRSWYEVSIGSAGAKHALTDFQVQYEHLLSEGKKGEAKDLLAGTLASAQKVLWAMRTAREDHDISKAGNNPGQALTLAYWKAQNTLKAAGVGISDKEYQSQVALVGLLQDQLHVTKQITTLQDVQTKNAELQEKKKAGTALTITPVAKVTDPHFTGDPEAHALQVLQLSVRERLRLRQQAARNDAELVRSGGALRIAAEKQNFALEHSLRQATISQQLAEDTKLADEEFNVKMQALQRLTIAAAAGGEEHLNDLRALQEKERQLVQQHEGQLTAIKERAEISRNQSLRQSMQQWQATVDQGLVQSIMRHQTWGSMVTSIENQVVSTMMASALKHIEANAMTKQSDAAAAARKMFNAGLKFPFPANLVMAPTLAAGAYATVMAFQHGTDNVPGVGRGDVVPAMLSPGEGVVPGGVMEGLRGIAKRGGFEQSGSPVHYHDRRTFHIHAVDQHGVREMLEKHSDEFERHFHRVMRARHA